MQSIEYLSTHLERERSQCRNQVYTPSYDAIFGICRVILPNSSGRLKRGKLGNTSHDVPDPKINDMGKAPIQVSVEGR